MRGLEQIPWLYDGLCAVVEATGLGRWRRWLAAGARGLTLDLGWYDAVTGEALAFERRAAARVEWLRNALRWDDSESMRTVFAMRQAEVGFGKTIILGLYPCLVAPRKDLDRLAKWAALRQTEEEAIKRIEGDRQGLSKMRFVDPFVAWLHLNVWPFVVVAALSLKFAKGVAALRTMRPRHKEDVDHHQPEPSSVPASTQAIQPEAQAASQRKGDVEPDPGLTDCHDQPGQPWRPTTDLSGPAPPAAQPERWLYGEVRDYSEEMGV